MISVCLHEKHYFQGPVSCFIAKNETYYSSKNISFLFVDLRFWPFSSKSPETCHLLTTLVQKLEPFCIQIPTFTLSKDIFRQFLYTYCMYFIFNFGQNISYCSYQTKEVIRFQLNKYWFQFCL